MKTLRIYLVIMFACLLFSNMLIAQDIPQPVDPDEAKPEVKKDENKKLYDLTLAFKKDMKFSEYAVADVNMDIDVAGEKMNQNIYTGVGVQFEVMEVENGKLKKAKITFNKMDIKLTFNGQEIPSEFGAGFYGIAVFDKDGKMSFESTSEDFPEELKSEFENKDFIGYHAPTKGIAIGEEWIVDSKIMKEQLKQYSVDEVESKMKLEKVTTQGEGENKIEVASIKMTITFSGNEPMSGLELKGKAEGTILMDITNHRLISRKLTMTIEGEATENGNTVTLTGKITSDDKFTYGDEKPQTRPNKEEVAPKGDDDE